MILPWRPVSIDNGPPISTSLTAAEADALRELAADARVLEIGSAYGYSTIAMAQVAQHVWAVDPHVGYGSLPDSLMQMTANLAAYGVTDKVTVVRANSATFVSEASFHLAFIDGDHRREAVEHDEATVWPLIHKFGGTLAFHDYGEDTCPGVKAALDALYPDGPDRLVDTLWIRRV